MRKIKAIAIDLDGTLVHFTLDYLSIRRDVISYFDSKGLDPTEFSRGERAIVMLERATKMLIGEGRSKEVKELRREVSQILEKYEMENVRRTQAVKGATEILRDLKREGFKLGLFTANGRKAVEQVLSKLDLAQFFDVVVTRDDVDAVKPDENHLKHLFQLIEAKPSEVLVVGDSTIDVEPAVRTGALPLGVRGGIASAQDLREKGAVDVIDSFAELLIWMRRKGVIASGDGFGRLGDDH